MDIAGSKGVIVSESWAGGGASILARDIGRRFDDVFRIVRTVEILPLLESTFAHIAGLALQILLFIVSKWRWLRR
jgi:hypothetical protein